MGDSQPTLKQPEPSRSGIMLAKRRRLQTTDSGRRTADRRRGVTLVEMLVTVAVLVIMMTILVQIFQAATGSVSAAQAFQQLDDQLRRLDSIIRADLEGATARFTPPLDPAQNLGYFEYGENEFADSQGEDGDDYIRFTAKAPPGRPFTGRFWPNYWNNSTTTQTFQPVSPSQTTSGNLGFFPVTITSDYAEIIYFLRNGNLYRRVFLIAPQLQQAVVPTVGNTVFGNSFTSFQPTILGQTVSWLGVNDLSAHPAPTGPNANSTTALSQAQSTIVLNTLGNLTNRENRAFYPRFSNDFYNTDPAAAQAGAQPVSSSLPDGIPDDVNQDNVPDLYPSLYPGLFSSSIGGTGPPADAFTGKSTNQLVFELNYPNSARPGVGYLAFPYVFPGAYSQAQALTYDAYGWIHAPSPHANVNGTLVQFDTGTGSYTSLDYLNNINHNPLDLGDNLLAGAQVQSSEQTTWWGFPTWRETMSPSWNDPTVQVNIGPNVIANATAQSPPTPQPPAGLTYASLSVKTGNFASPATDTNLLPPMRDPGGLPVNFSIFRQTQDPFSDAQGQLSAFWATTNKTNTTYQSALWSVTFEDDLILTNVRSFDVKAYDNALVNYGDLGWGDDLRLYLPYQNLTGFAFSGLIGNASQVAPPAIAGTPQTIAWPPINPTVITTTPVYNTLQTMAHEGRMPPLVSDNRLDSQYPNQTYVNATTFTPQYSAYASYSSNLGDDNSGIVRLRRVWDTWSTDYSRAPATGVNSSSTGGGFPVGPPFSPPIYPSYPPPYPAPLRGIQIQIRVADPSNQRIKSLTIRQDFTDKL
jgi:prepilin-type N-terminal cleavage/methylation domain-containing protein